MLKILCCNAMCTAPERTFEWDEKDDLQAGGRLAEKGDEDAVSFVRTCPYCGTKNKIWVTKVKASDVPRGMV
jgi:hypothetical protein